MGPPGLRSRGETRHHTSFLLQLHRSGRLRPMEIHLTVLITALSRAVRISVAFGRTMPEPGADGREVGLSVGTEGNR